MSTKRVGSVPQYRHFKPKNLAVVRIQGHDIYLGEFNSAQSRERYDRAIAEWLANGRRVLPVPASNQSRPLSVNELLLAYLQHAGEFYAQDGEVSKEVVNLGHAISPVKNLYGLPPAAEFGPLALKAIRHYMIETQKLCRTEINKRIGRIKRAFKWAVSEELIPPSVFEGLRSVEGLRQGRSAARESGPVKPVPDAHVAALMPFVSSQVAAMIQLQRLTGMRPGEVVIMRHCDLDRSSEVWLYTPTRHKTSYLGVEKQVAVGMPVFPLFERESDPLRERTIHDLAAHPFWAPCPRENSQLDMCRSIEQHLTTVEKNPRAWRHPSRHHRVFVDGFDRPQDVLS